MKRTFFNRIAALMFLVLLPVSPSAVQAEARVKAMKVKSVSADTGVVTAVGVEGDTEIQLRLDKPGLLKDLKVGDTIGVNLDEKTVTILFNVTLVAPHAHDPAAGAAALAQARATANLLACGNNLRQLGLATQMYAASYKGKLPLDLGVLYASGLVNDPKIVLCPGSPAVAVPKDFEKLKPAEKADWVNANAHYVYAGAGLKVNVANPTEVVVVYEKPAAHGDQAVGVCFADGHYERVTPERWVELQSLQLGNTAREGKPVGRVDVKDWRNESIEFTAATKDGKKLIARNLLQPAGVSLPAGEYLLQVGRRTIPIVVPEPGRAPVGRNPAGGLRRPAWLANIVVNPNNANVAFAEYDGPLMRFYNSRSLFDGPFGFGWTFDYSTRLRRNEQGLFEVDECDGSVTAYRQAGAGRHRAVASSFPSELIEEQGRVVRRMEGSSYLQKFGRPVSEEVFSPGGQLLSIKHTAGEVHELKYEKDVIKAVVDIASGKALYEFARDATGHITEMTTPSGRRFIYKYDGKCLAAVTDPGGARTGYEYSDRYNLTGIAFPDAGHAVFQYDEAKDWLRSMRAEGVEHHFEYGQEGAGHFWTIRTDEDANVKRWDYFDTQAMLISTVESIESPQPAVAVEKDDGKR